MLEAQNENNKSVYKAISVFLIILSVFFVFKIFDQIKGENNSFPELHTISVSGEGEIKAIPDIAEISLSITKEAKTVKEAQEAVAQIEGKALEFLRDNGVLDKDIKTTNASFGPKYEYRYDAPRLVPCESSYCPPVGRNVIVGYQSSETIQVKIRDVDNTGTILEGIGALGVTDLYGPNFTIDDEDTLKAEARKLAIEEAKEKAQILAKDLGVRLGKIVSFNEDQNYYPFYSARGSADLAVAQEVKAELPVGENTVSANVTITYEIK